MTRKMEVKDQMGICLAPDDIVPGSFVTVHSHIARMDATEQRRPSSGRARANFSAVSIPAGLPLCVIAISMPFIACGMIEPGGELDGPLMLDLRRVRLCRLNADFVKAITEFPNHVNNCMEADIKSIDESPKRVSQD